jgi:hypothetical protein
LEGLRATFSKPVNSNMKCNLKKEVASSVTFGSLGFEKRTSTGGRRCDTGILPCTSGKSLK